jgi:hypothetical protein
MITIGGARWSAVMGCLLLWVAQAAPASDGGDALVSAALRGDLAGVEALLALGVDADARSNTLPHSPLNAATLAGCGKAEHDYVRALHVIDALLAAGANPNAVEGAGASTLTMAAQRCPGEVVSRLLDAGGDVAHRSPQGWGPLSMALIAGNKSAARVLVDRGARLSAATLDRLSGNPTNDPELRELLRRARAD